MTKVLAIAALTVRSAIRSRVFIAILTVLLLVVVAVPLTIKGDGTVAGRVQVLLHFTLSAAVWLLSASTIWAACSAMSIELRDRQLHMVLSKPVHRAQLWLGKWLALIGINAVLLLAAGVIPYGLIQWTVRPGALSADESRELHEQTLVARTALPLRLADGSPFDAPMVVPADERREWRLSPPHMPDNSRPLLLRYRIISSRQVEQRTIAGEWSAVAADGTWATTQAVTSVGGRLHQTSLDLSGLGGAAIGTIAYRNTESAVPATVLFNAADGLEALAYRGGFGPNFARALLVVFCHLAFLSALGLSAGTMLSLPVAVFASFTFMLFVSSSDYVERVATEEYATYASEHGHDHGGHDHGGAEPLRTRAVDTAVKWVFKGLHVILRPLVGHDPLPQLAEGREVAWQHVGRAVLVFLVVYSGILGCGATAVFARKEIAKTT